jgi:hypothetical protein
LLRSREEQNGRRAVENGKDREVGQKRRMNLLQLFIEALVD